MTPADFDRLLGFVNDEPFHDLLTFAYEAGVRPQEARQIEARHVRLDRHRVEIPPEEAKGKKRWRVIYLSEKAEVILTRLMLDRPEGSLFRNSEGNPWKAQAIVCRFQRLLVKMTGADTKFPPPCERPASGAARVRSWRPSRSSRSTSSPPNSKSSPGP